MCLTILQGIVPRPRLASVCATVLQGTAPSPTFVPPIPPTSPPWAPLASVCDTIRQSTCPRARTARIRFGAFVSSISCVRRFLQRQIANARAASTLFFVWCIVDALLSLKNAVVECRVYFYQQPLLPRLASHFIYPCILDMPRSRLPRPQYIRVSPREQMYVAHMPPCISYRVLYS